MGHGCTDQPAGRWMEKCERSKVRRVQGRSGSIGAAFAKEAPRSRGVTRCKVPFGYRWLVESHPFENPSRILREGRTWIRERYRIVGEKEKEETVGDARDRTLRGFGTIEERPNHRG